MNVGRLLIAVLALLGPANSAVSQAAEVRDFELAVAYCLGMTAYANTLETPYPGCLAAPTTQEIANTCATVREVVQQGHRQLEERIARFRAYLALKMTEPQSAASIAFAERQGQTDAVRASGIANRCDTEQCAEDELKRAGPDAVAAVERRKRCDAVSAQLPF